MNDARFIVRDRNGQALGYFSFEDEPGRQAAGGSQVTAISMRSGLGLLL